MDCLLFSKQTNDKDFNFYECRKKNQPKPVAKNATPRSSIRI